MGAFANPFPAVSKSQVVNGLTGYFDTTIFNQTTPVTVGNTGAETSLLSTSGALGTLTIPASFFQIGSRFLIKSIGTIGTEGIVPSITLKAYFGATVISTATLTPAAQIVAGTYFEHWVECTVLTIGATGTFKVAQVMWTANSAVSGPVVAPTTSAAVDMTVAGAIDLKITWGTAGALSTTTVSQARIEVAG